MPVKGDIQLQIDRIGKRLRLYKRDFSRAGAQAMIEAAVEILDKSNATCPYEKGDLRNSGTAFLSGTHGRYEEVVKVRGAGRAGGGSSQVVGMPTYTSYIWNMLISYERYGNTGFDVAWFTHENIVSGRKGNTGPKYLENALDAYRSSFEGAVARRVEGVIKKYGMRGTRY